jgi:hypothetical protein
MLGYHQDGFETHAKSFPKNVKPWGKHQFFFFSSLIPKESNPSFFYIFSPISLFNSSYKIPIKMLVNSVKMILPRIISNNQGLFMKK